MACVNQEFPQGVDEQTAYLIIQLQLQDADYYSSSSKGKAREDEASDESIAFQLQKQELENVSIFLSDRRMTKSIADAVQTDGPILGETLSQEDVAVRDRGMARQFSEGAETSNVDYPDSRSESQPLDDELLAKLQVLYVSGFEETRQGLLHQEHNEDGQEESSTWAASRPNPSLIAAYCEACREEKKFFEVARVPCRHEYCRACLEDLFKTAMTDESYFPPRCCHQQIPIIAVRIFLSSELVQAFERKKIEFETPNRTYCYLPTCSAFINTQDVNGEGAECHECGSMTCTTCKAAAHAGDCPNDAALQQVLETARENGWQRCYSCWRLVELDHGCNHMTCRCGAQFCYVCGQKWKNCGCEQWDEHRLLVRANQIIDREPEPLPQPLADPLQHLQQIQLPEDSVQAVRNALVARTVQNLRDNHECNSFSNVASVIFKLAADAGGIDSKEMGIAGYTPTVLRFKTDDV
ncbi:hypothetical protein V502_02968 [Pseudogymnoascus sp. VKM F-4520 (FW-2644)]|nr:hypothetical protein V502_02968 [Pseudogymnoascus sp. VKM F-4520 (FW-2644)]